MRSEGQPPADRIVRVFLTCLSPRRRRNDRFSPTAPARGAALAEASCRIAILRSRFATRRGQRPVFLLRRATRGRRPQRPGNQSRRARFWKFPPAIHFRESPVIASSPLSFGPVRNFHVSLNTLSVTLLLTASQKPLPIVQKLWTSRLPCGRPRKSKARIEIEMLCVE